MSLALPDEDKLYRFISAMRYFGHSSIDQDTVVQLVALNDTREFPNNLDHVYERFVKITESHVTSRSGVPEFNDPLVHTAVSNISGRIKKAGKKTSPKRASKKGHPSASNPINSNN